nr:YobH family protein [Escherichia coli]
MPLILRYIYCLVFQGASSIGSKENAAGLGLQCTYLTARGTSTVQYLHTKSGFLGITDCPLLRKSNIVVDNG